MLTKSPIGQSIAALEQERANLTARLAKIDAAIATLRDLFHLPPRRVGKRGTDDHVERAIRAALADGPLSPRQLADAAGCDRATLRRQVGELTKRRVLITSGATANRRIALAASPAKEAIRSS